MEVNDKIDEFEQAMMDYPLVDCPLKHRFVKGMYIREIFMPAGSWVTSLIHKTNHPFFVLQGTVSVYSDNDGEQLIEAPYIGTTTPATRRVLYTHSDVIWITWHKTEIQPTDDSEQAILEAVDKVAADIIKPHENKLLGGTIKNNILYKSLNK